jgi:type II secretory pathway component PulK
MLSRWQFNVVVLLAVVSLVLVIANMALFSRNRVQQQEISDRQLYVQQTAQLEGLYQQLIRGIAELSARNNDTALGAVLARQGITFSVTPNAQQAPTPADAGASARSARK